MRINICFITSLTFENNAFVNNIFFFIYNVLFLVCEKMRKHCYKKMCTAPQFSSHFPGKITPWKHYLCLIIAIKFSIFYKV